MAAPPMVTICIPTYDGARYLAQAIASALGQTFANLAVVVVDNASTDETPAVVRGFDDPRLAYVRYPEHVGMVDNFRRAFALAEGRYMVFLCSDDYLYPAFLERTVAALEAAPDAGLAFCDVDYVDDAGVRYDGFAAPLPAVVAGDAFLRASIGAGKNFIHLSGCLVEREVLARAGGVSADNLFFDWDMWLRVAAHTHLCHVAEPLLAYRHHPANTTKTLRSYVDHGQELIAVIEGFVTRHRPHDAALRAALRQGIDQLCWEYGRLVMAACLRHDMAHALPAELARLLRPGLKPITTLALWTCLATARVTPRVLQALYRLWRRFVWR